MKNEKVIYGIGSLAIIGAAITKIWHLPNANTMIIFVLVGMSCIETWHVLLLKKRIKELEIK